MSTTQDKVFLTAEWRYLAMLNYEVEPSLLEPYVPFGAEIATWNGKIFLSMVGFLFLNARLKGLPVPLHQTFEEVNLRFYVRRKLPDGWRKGVVFIKEIVPRMAVAYTARLFFNENYTSLNMRRQIQMDSGSPCVEYAWKTEKRWNHMFIRSEGEAEDLVPESVEEFLVQNHWGFTAISANESAEYRVEHPPWRIWKGKESRLDCDIAELFGRPFVNFLTLLPSYAFIADGSPVAVFERHKIPHVI